MKNTLLILLVSMIAFTSCNQPKPVNTIKNLKEGIIGETTASAKYEAFAEKAIAEGYDTIANLFYAASKAEAIHAANHKKVLEDLGEKMDDFTPEFEVKTTAENLQAAIDGESYEVSTMYVKFLEDAKTEKVEKATKSFTWAMDTEKKHLELYKSALAALNANAENTLSFEYAVCPVCGNTFERGKMDEICGFCATSSEKYIIIK